MGVLFVFCFFRFHALIAGETLPFTLVVRDPLGNSFIGSSEHENPADDPKITVRAEEGSVTMLQEGLSFRVFWGRGRRGKAGPKSLARRKLPAGSTHNTHGEVRMSRSM